MNTKMKLLIAVSVLLPALQSVAVEPDLVEMLYKSSGEAKANYLPPMKIEPMMTKLSSDSYWQEKPMMDHIQIKKFPIKTVIQRELKMDVLAPKLVCSMQDGTTVKVALNRDENQQHEVHFPGSTVNYSVARQTFEGKTVYKLGTPQRHGLHEIAQFSTNEKEESISGISTVKACRVEDVADLLSKFRLGISSGNLGKSMDEYTRIQTAEEQTGYLMERAAWHGQLMKTDPKAADILRREVDLEIADLMKKAGALGGADKY